MEFERSRWSRYCLVPSVTLYWEPLLAVSMVPKVQEQTACGSAQVFVEFTTVLESS